MVPSRKKSSLSLQLRISELLRSHPTTNASAGAMCAGLLGALIAGATTAAPTRPSVPQVCFTESQPGCPPAQPRVNLAFIIDRSGSMANQIVAPLDTEGPGRGLTYTVEIEGVLRAVRDPTVIPRDGTVAVTVVSFNGRAVVPVTLRVINSAPDAEAIATKVEGLKCADLDSSVDPCPSGDTRYEDAILAANDQLKNRQQARRVFLISTDGEPKDRDLGMSASTLAREQANRDRVEAELDVILMGLNAEVTGRDTDGLSELERNKNKVEKIVFPLPTTDLPGKTFVINRGVCNLPGAGLGMADPVIEADCDRQIAQFAELVRRILRSDVSTSSLVVRTDADTEPDTLPSDNEGLSLRQAIEQANKNRGSTTITFDSSLKDKNIQPRVPLPALTAPDITICGCDENNCDPSVTNEPCNPLVTNEPCNPLVTIDGSKTDTTKGEAHSDGILIRSNHDIVRGLKIINFKRAGVAIDPVCQCDIVGNNRVERNTLENNKVAGVLVLDPPPNQANAVAHNVGNTILGNTILDSLDNATPIDLRGDGRTNNDLCDIDQGPNTLLNFPYSVIVTMSASGVTVTGTVCDPNCATQVCQANLIGAVVEIFAVTRYGTNSANQAANGLMGIQSDSDNRVITGVAPLARGTTRADGSFSISCLPLSTTCGYTATVTDTAGNTSELMFPCVGFAKAEILPQTIEFDLVAPRRKSRKERKQPSRTFTIENTGCAPLDLSFKSIRTGSDVDSGKITDTDDSKLFSISVINPGGIETAFAPETTIRIAQGQRVTLRVRFNPVIPRRVLLGNKLRAADTLPDTITSLLTLNHNSCGVPTSTINLTAHVTTEVHLIDPEIPSNPTKVTLERSEDNLFVTFSVFDSNLDVNTVNYEFFKTRDGLCRTSEPVPANIVDRDLTKAIKERMLVTGQSFSVIQRFSGANNHPEAGCVRVTVSDGNTNASATSLPATGSLGSGSVGSTNLRRLRGATIVRPTLKLPISPSRPRASIVSRAVSGRIKTQSTSGANNTTRLHKRSAQPLELR